MKLFKISTNCNEENLLVLDSHIYLKKYSDVKEIDFEISLEISIFGCHGPKNQRFYFDLILITLSTFINIYYFNIYQHKFLIKI